MLPLYSRFTKVYQVQAHWIQILHESEKPIEELQIPTLPCKLEQKALSFDMSPCKAPFISFQYRLWISLQKGLPYGLTTLN